MNDRLTIEVLNDTSEPKRGWKCHADLPTLPLQSAIIGPRNSGKSNLLGNFLSKKKEWYGGFFQKENIIIYSPTLTWDKMWKKLDYPHKYGPMKNINELFNDVKTQQEVFMKDDAEDEVLVVLDDLTPVPDGWKHTQYFSFIGRHFHIHLKYVSHKLSSVPRGCRLNTTQWYLFEPHEGSEIDQILECFASRATYQTWFTALRRCWDQPYNFALINFQEREFNRRYRSGFHDPLFTEEEQMQIRNCSYHPKTINKQSGYELQSDISVDSHLLDELERQEEEKKLSTVKPVTKKRRQRSSSSQPSKKTKR